MENKQIEGLGYNGQADDEIDLFELFSSLCKQWRWLVGITVMGSLIAVAVALSIPKQYEVTAQVALPDLSGVMQVMNKGYLESSSQSNSERNLERSSQSNLEQEASKLFQRYYEKLLSPMHFNKYVKENAWLQKFYPIEEINGKESFLQVELKKYFKVEILAPKQLKKGPSSPPRIVSITLMGRDEGLTADFINGYIDNTNKMLLLELVSSGKEMAVAEIEKINKDISVMRFEAKKKREARLVRLQDALVIAKKIGIKKPDSIRIFGEAYQRSLNGLTSQAKEGDLFLMGSEYLEAEINILSSKESDDAYIVELPEMLKRIDELQSLSFDFASVKLYKLDKQAVTDGKAEKPKRTLIVAVGTVLSGFIAIFVALIMSAVKRRRELEL